MHRVTPYQASFRGYSSGGGRTLIDKVDDDSMMQSMNGSVMKGEGVENVEAPQNYGFSSVVLPAKKGKDGQIDQCAEGFMSFMGGHRSFPVCSIMDDRRHRPMGLKAGENAQYDDIGQMTLLRRTGTYVLSLDSEDESQQQSGSGGGAREEGGSSGGDQKKKVERMVSLRHVEKKKQERDFSGGQDGGQGGSTLSAEQQAAKAAETKKKRQEHKHEGETVNTEVRCTKNRIEFRAGDKVVGYYDVKEDTWFFTAKLIHSKGTSEIKDEAPKINHN